MLDNSWVVDYIGLSYALPLIELLRRHAYLLASRIARTIQFLLKSAMPAFDGNRDAASSTFKMTHRCLQLIWAGSFLNLEASEGQAPLGLLLLRHLYVTGLLASPDRLVRSR